MKLIAQLILALVLAPSAGFANQESRFIQGWTVAKGDTSCIATTTFQDDTDWSFFLNWRDNTISLMLRNPRWQSLKGSDKTFDLRIELSPHDDAFWHDDLKPMTDSKTPGFVMWWDGTHTNDLMVDFSIASGAVVTASGTRLGNYSMKGTQAAILELVKCGATALKNDRSDPFAN